MKSLKLRILLLTILLVKVEAQEIDLENRSPETNARTVLLKETEEREGLKYIPGKKLPFTGKIFSPYNKSLYGIETNYRRGKKHGIETTYINGLITGLRNTMPILNPVKNMGLRLNTRKQVDPFGTLHSTNTGKRMDSRLNFGKTVPKEMKSNIWMIYPSAWKWDTL